jgi:hypothetical protein
VFGHPVLCSHKVPEQELMEKILYKRYKFHIHLPNHEVIGLSDLQDKQLAALLAAMIVKQPNIQTNRRTSYSSNI